VAFGPFSAASARIFSRGRAAAANDSERLEAAPPPDLRELARRTVPRDLIDHLTTITVSADELLDARLIDVSPYGFQARARGPILTRGDRITVHLPLVGDLPCHVMWGLKGFFGCKFIDPVEPDTYVEMLTIIRAWAPDSDTPTPGKAPG
jgi:hypothetical protein